MSITETNLTPPAPPRSLVLWRRFRRNRAAVLSLGLFMIVLAMAAQASCLPPPRTAIRTSFRAGSGSGSASRGRWQWSRG